MASDAGELLDWLDSHKLNPKTRYSYISHLASFWRWAVINDLTIVDVTMKLSRPKMRRGLPRPLAVEDLRMLIDRAPTTAMKAMITLGGFAGLRCMEIAQIAVNDILETMNPPCLIVANGKGGKSRVIPISAPVIDALRAHGGPSQGAIFRDDNGDPYYPWKISQILRKHIHDCGLNTSGHALRHTFGTEVYRRSNDLRMTQELLGHSSPQTTAVYCAWAQDKAAGVVATLFT